MCHATSKQETRLYEAPAQLLKMQTAAGFMQTVSPPPPP